MSSYGELFSQTNHDEATRNITNAFLNLFYRFSQVKNSINHCSGSNSTTDSNSGSSNLNNNNNSGLSLNDGYLCNKLQQDLNQIKEAFLELEQLVRIPIKNFPKQGNKSDLIYCWFTGVIDFERSLNNILVQGPSGSLTTKDIQDKLSALENHAMNMRFHNPFLPNDISSTSSDVHRYLWKNEPSSGVNKLPSLHQGHKFLYSPVFIEFKEVFEDLDIKLKRCLLCFAIVLENEVVKKRLLINWWIGECLVDPPDTGKKTDEEIADEILGELMLKRFIEPVKDSHKLVTNRYKMQPRVRYLVIILATEAGIFDYDFNGNSIANSSRCNRTYLLKAADGTSKQLVAKSPDLELEKLQTIFNVSEPFPFLRFEWFSKMKNVKVLYLGRWQSSDKYHIEVESTEFLKGLKNMKSLRLLSLQGISGINELPNSIGKLTTLRILDLKACHNLEALPVKISFLKQLTHLDISGCYLLDGLPKGLAHLSELQVLKGFSIGNLRRGKPCTLEDLIGLKKLGKLSITTSSMAFPTKEELHALSNLEAIRKLAIEWSVKQENGVLVSAGTVDSDNRGDNKRPAAKITGAISKTCSKQRTLKNSETPELPSELEKLELRCFPHRGRPDWLIPKKLESLKKLYIRGGELENLGQMEENDKWKVEILRLKHLNKFRMNWDVLKISFPKLIFLENVNCPNLSYSECDKDGLWPKQSSSVSNTL